MYTRVYPGSFFLRDAEEQKMQLPAGDYEIQLILQDRTLNDQGQLVYCPTYEDGQGLPQGEWGPGISPASGREWLYLSLYRRRTLPLSAARAQWGQFPLL